MMDDREITLADLRGPLLAFGGASDGIAPVAARAARRRPGDGCAGAPVRGRAGRPPGHADRPGGPVHHLAHPGRRGSPAHSSTGAEVPKPRAARHGRGQEGPGQEEPHEEAGEEGHRPRGRHRVQPGAPLRVRVQPRPRRQESSPVTDGRVLAAATAPQPDARFALVLVALVALAIRRRGWAASASSATRSPPPSGRSCSWPSSPWSSPRRCGRWWSFAFVGLMFAVATATSTGRLGVPRRQVLRRAGHRGRHGARAGAGARVGRGAVHWAGRPADRWHRHRQHDDRGHAHRAARVRRDPRLVRLLREPSPSA